jgi:hypothetical protein
MTSGFPPEADTVTDGRHVSKVPRGDIGIASANEKRPPQLAASFPYWSLLGPVFVRIENAETRPRRPPPSRR